jgi:16S rRNA (cytosine967-C5)-methyltransferase
MTPPERRSGKGAPKGKSSHSEGRNASSGRPRGPRPTRQGGVGSDARLAAAHLIRACLEQAKTLDAAEHDVALLGLLGTGDRAAEGLSTSDRGFARGMALASLRGLGLIDRRLAGHLDRPLTALDPAVLALLRIGAAQMLLMGVAAHAAVSATVGAAALDPDARRAGGLINAILRRISEGGPIDPETETEPEQVWPDWLARRFIAALGLEGARAFARSQLIPAPIDLSFKPEVDILGYAGPLEGQVIGQSLRLIEPGDVTALAGFEAGDWWVQDLAAALPATLLAARPGEKVLDLCAAPGGKTLQMAAAGAEVTALDQSRNRLARLADNLVRTQLTASLVEADARRWQPSDTLGAGFDAVLLDAPCSAMGTLRRHPEGAWIKPPESVRSLMGLQDELVGAARRLIRPGGRLVYCVCSPLSEEGKSRIDQALAGGGWKADPFGSGELGGFSNCLTPEGHVLTGPGRRGDGHDSDGFFIARLIRAEAG